MVKFDSTTKFYILLTIVAIALILIYPYADDIGQYVRGGKLKPKPAADTGVTPLKAPPGPTIPPVPPLPNTCSGIMNFTCSNQECKIFNNATGNYSCDKTSLCAEACDVTSQSECDDNASACCQPKPCEDITNETICTTVGCTWNPAPCQDLIDFSIEHPDVIFNEHGITFYNNYNATYYGSEWLDGMEYNYTKYYSSWYTYYDNKYYNIHYDFMVFDDWYINLDSWVERIIRPVVCVKWPVYANGVENKVYVCNWDVLNDQQDTGNKIKQIIWTNNNVAMRITTILNEQLTEEDIYNIAQQNMMDFLLDISNNEAEMLGWEYYGTDYPLDLMLEKLIGKCPSEIPISECEPCWQCKTEPVVCPPHGYKIRTCVDYCCDSEPLTEYLYCSPGICDGCIYPRYIGKIIGGGESGESAAEEEVVPIVGPSASLENRCIPYGFRFTMGYETEEGLIEKQNEEYLPEMSSPEISLTVLNNTNAILIFNVSEYVEYYFTINESQIVDDPEGNSEIEYLLTPIQIDYYGPGDTSNGVLFLIEYSYMGTIYTDINGYCDIDGHVKPQKKIYSDEPVPCHNNFECESNVCSSGECIDLKAMTEKTNIFMNALASAICRITTILNSENYEQCVYDFFN